MVDVTVNLEVQEIDLNVTTTENSCDVVVSIETPAIDIEIQPSIIGVSDVLLAQRVTELENEEHIIFNNLPQLP